MEIAVGADPRAGEAHVADVVAPGLVVLAVADGFGTIRGVTTARAATDALRDALRVRLRGRGKDPEAALAHAVRVANDRVYRASGSNDDYVASGASLTAALVSGDRAFVVHAGRTHALLCRNGFPAPLTRDDALDVSGSPFGAAVERTLARAPLRETPILTKTLGTAPALEPEVDVVRLEAGDAIVLITPALHDALDDLEIARALREIADAEDGAARVLALGERREASGVAIVGRAFDALDLVPPPSTGARFAAAGLALLLIAAIVAGFALHGVVGP